MLLSRKMLRLENVLQNSRSGQDGFWALVILISGTGLAVLFSSSFYFSRGTSGDPYRMVLRQLIWVLLGVILMILISRLSPDRIKKSVPALSIITLILNCLTYVPFLGRSAGGAQRWIGITVGSMDLTFQPSELIKIVLVLYLARMFEKNRHRQDDFVHAVLPPLLVLFLFVGLVFLQNDFSTAVYLFFIALFMLIIMGVHKVYIFGLSAFFSGIATVMVLIKPYRLKRITAWFHPERDPLSSGYQILKAQSALKAGGFWGRGWGGGLIKRGGLPQSYSDFIAAVIGEEAGFLGIVFIVILFVLVLWEGGRIFFQEKDDFSRYAALGLCFALFFQALLNLGVAAGLFPATGIPLPLFSAGGSSALVAMVIFGLVGVLGRVETDKIRKRIEVV